MQVVYDMLYSEKKMDYQLEMSQVIGNMLMLSYRTLMDRIGSAFKQNGLAITPEQYGVLICLYGKGAEQQKNIAKLLRRDETSVSRMINTMVRCGLVTREGHETDKRARMIRPTQKAIEMRQQLFESSKAAVEEVFEFFTENEIKTFMDMLERIILWKE